MSLVGIVANPASGKDIRRLVAYGSVFDNQEKVRIVRRVLLGLMATGIERICFMPDYFGIVRRALDSIKAKIPVFPVNFKATATQKDSIRAAEIMAERGAGCIVTLGGDGTNRAVAKGCQQVPILPVSTGTNNVFPLMVEGTIAGLAAGLVARKLTPLEESTIASTRLEIIIDGKMEDIALVDAAVYDDPFIGSRAVWDLDKVPQIFLNRADPASIGLSALGGLVRRVLPEEPLGLNLTLGTAGRRVTAPVAPGIIQDVYLSSLTVMNMGDEQEVICKPSLLALDGEREVEVKKDQQASVRLGPGGPRVVDVARTMESARQRGLLTTPEEAEPV